MLSVAFAGSGRYIQGASIGVNAKKRIFVDLTYAKVSPMQMYALQGGATIKCRLANRGYTIGKGDVFQRGATIKCLLANRGYTGGKGVLFQFIPLRKTDNCS